MTQDVSISEKTLEHWVSQYVLYRYRSSAQIWWPTQGEDADVQNLPFSAGKAVKLEIKTATPTYKRHDIHIDRGQLWKYTQRPLSLRPYYVVPIPRWERQITGRWNRGWRLGQHESQLAFRRSNRFYIPGPVPRPYFADWMRVISTADVAAMGSAPRLVDTRGLQ